MDTTLSQDEVDALLQGMRDGEVNVQQVAGANEPRPYNLVGRERSVSRQFPGLEIVQDKLVRHLRQSFSGLLGTSVGIDVESADLLRYARYRNRLEPSSPLSLFSLEPLHGNGLLALSPSLVFQLVDRIFGGQGSAPTPAEAREYSPVEMQVVARVASLVLSDLEEAWSMVTKLECNFLRTEMNVAVVPIAASEDLVFALELQCDLGCGPARFTLALPIGILEPVRSAMSESRGAPPKRDQGWVDCLDRAVRGACVDVSVELGSQELSAGQLLQLEVGHLLHLSTRPEDPVAICVEGAQVMTGVVGTNRGQNAVRVLPSS